MEPEENGYGTDGYAQGVCGSEASGWGSEANVSLGAGDNPWQVDHISNPLQENLYAADSIFDTPFNETPSNPNPHSPTSEGLGYSFDTGGEAWGDRTASDWER
ncbi:hypothetical protein H6F67_26190 [Microcoleus sp. FACHB-1515]|uniref:hypothetical protein n=1 Tax=Cyanophyceae TaxID=3028117 RepID=UPI001682E868|nr:hypothetical protein [Microcoleus sp. FACHB-1515]MBD2093339.1 hypothetical protein [Microcoleus sp. FACHB-1515]